MNVTQQAVLQLDITEVDGLDRIKVILENIGPGQGQITVVCWGSAWTAYFGAMGTDNTIERFAERSPADYMVGKMLGDSTKLMPQYRGLAEKYLLRIVEAVQAALRETYGVTTGSAS